jgi:hypothetical protein
LAQARCNVSRSREWRMSDLSPFLEYAPCSFTKVQGSQMYGSSLPWTEGALASDSNDQCRSPPYEEEWEAKAVRRHWVHCYKVSRRRLARTGECRSRDRYDHRRQPLKNRLFTISSINILQFYQTKTKRNCRLQIADCRLQIVI